MITPPHVNIEKIDKPMKILGVFFTYDWRKRQELNFEEILKLLSKSIKRWEWRNLTLYGKIQVLKTFVIPKFMFRASLISLTKNIIKLVDSTIYSFIWKGRDKIKRLALISDYKNGGLRMPHTQTMIDTQRIMCLKKYSEDYISPWKQILSFFLKDYGGKFLLHCNFCVADLPSCLPNFYRECFEVWCNLSVEPILSREQALNQLLWNNQFLRIGGKPIFNKTLFSKGLISLANILTNTGSLKPWTFFKAKGLNVNDYLLLFGLFNSFPPAWKRLISSNDKISPDTLANTSADSHNTNFSYTLHLKMVVFHLIQSPPLNCIGNL